MRHARSRIGTIHDALTSTLPRSACRSDDEPVYAMNKPAVPAGGRDATAYATRPVSARTWNNLAAKSEGGQPRGDGGEEALGRAR